MAKKQLPADFKEFIQSLNSNDVRYLLIGGWNQCGRSMDIADAEKLESQ